MFWKPIDNILFLTPTEPFEISSLGISECFTLSYHPCILCPHSDCAWVAAFAPATGSGLSGDTLIKCIQVFLASLFIEEGRKHTKKQWFLWKVWETVFCAIHLEFYLSITGSQFPSDISLRASPRLWVILTSHTTCTISGHLSHP